MSFLFTECCEWWAVLLHISYEFDWDALIMLLYISALFNITRNYTNGVHLV